MHDAPGATADAEQSEFRKSVKDGRRPIHRA